MTGFGTEIKFFSFTKTIVLTIVLNLGAKGVFQVSSKEHSLQCLV